MNLMADISMMIISYCSIENCMLWVCRKYTKTDRVIGL